MTLKLTPDMLRTGYEFLCTTEPFARWNLPDSDEIAFRVLRCRRTHGWFEVCGPRMEMAASSGTIGNLNTLLATLAHEIVHLHQHRTGMPMNHGATFKKLAVEVCKYHRDFDPKNF